MAIITLDDAQALQEIRYLLDADLTDADLPDAAITTRAVLSASNRRVLSDVGMTATEYDALDSTDVRREIFEEAVIRYCAIELSTGRSAGNIGGSGTVPEFALRKLIGRNT